MSPFAYKAARPWHLGGTLIFLVGALFIVRGVRESRALYFWIGGVLYAIGMALLWQTHRVLKRSRTDASDAGRSDPSDGNLGR